MKLHQQKLHKQPNIECAFCLKTFKSENEKSAHINAEHIDECNELLENDSRDLLNDDKDFREPSPEGVLVESCISDFCNKTFIGKRNLYAHK